MLYAIAMGQIKMQHRLAQSLMSDVAEISRSILRRTEIILESQAFADMTVMQRTRKRNV